MRPEKSFNGSAMLREMLDQYEAQSDNSTASVDYFSQCDDDEEGKYVWAFFSLFAFAVGSPASAAILWELFQTYRSGPFTPNDFLILNLSVVDVLFLIIRPVTVWNHFQSNSMAIELASAAFFALSSCGRPLLMACVCLDCYVAVLHPVAYHQRKSLLPRVAMVAVVWTLTFANGLALVLNINLFNTPFPIGGFLAGLVVIVICDNFIIQAISKSDGGRRGVHPQKQRAIQTLTVSLVMSVICYIPPIFLYVLGSLLINSTRVFTCKVAYPVTITSTLGSALMPLFSLYNVGKLKFMKPACCKI